MIVTCHPRAEIVAAMASTSETHAVISIHTPGQPRTLEPGPRIHVLAIDDADRGPRADESHCIQEPRLFSPTDAQAVVAFVRTHHVCGIRRVLIHCDAGISRSAGMAAALAKFYTGDDFWFFKHKRPNMLVYRLMMEALHHEA